MTNNQTAPNQKPDNNQLSDEELEEVAGGGIFGDLVDAAKDFVGDVIDDGNEFIFDVSDAFKKHH